MLELDQLGSRSNDKTKDIVLFTNIVTQGGIKR